MRRALPTVFLLIFVLVLSAVLMQPSALIAWTESMFKGTPTSVSGDQAQAAPDSPYADLQRNGYPVTYSPCEKWAVSINTFSAPPGYRSAVKAVIAEIRNLTGLKLVLGDDTDEVPTEDRRVYQPELYGDRPAPILIGWIDAEPSFVSGHDGSNVIVTEDGEQTYLSGMIRLNADGVLTEDELRAVLLHEMAHVVGLADSADEGSIMFGDPRGAGGFSDEQRKALKVLGNGKCIDPLAPKENGLAG
jgi:predicted Zn-dependent protease